MENFVTCVNAILPIFIIMVVGYAARCCGIINEEDVKKNNKLAFKVFLPVMLFSDIYGSELAYAVRPRLIAFAVIGVILVALLSIAVTLLLVKEKSKQGVVIQGLFRSNFVIIGVPIASSLSGGGDVSAAAVLLAIVVPIYNVLAVIVLSVFGRKKIEPGKILLGILKNPLIIGCMLGLLFMGLGIKLPKPLAAAVDSIAKVGSPLMLFLLGAFFQFSSLKRQGRELVIVCVGRLIIVPALLLGAAYWMGFKGIEMAALIGVFASSAAVSSFTMAQEMGGDAELAGDIVVTTSALCSFTLFIWCLLFKSLGVL